MSRGHLNFFDFIFIGRTYDVYKRMFDWGRRIKRQNGFSIALVQKNSHSRTIPLMA